MNGHLDWQVVSIMDFRQIEAFLSVYKLNSFSRAAESLYLTQPTVSAHVSALEAELGVKLFDRSSKEVQSTEAGRQFFDYALDMINSRDSAFISLKEYNQQIKGRVELAASTIPGQYLLPGAMKGFVEKYPEVRFSITQTDSKSVHDLLYNKSVELGIVGSKDQEERFEYHHLMNDHLVLITPNTEKYTNWTEEEITVDKLRKEPFVLREKGSGTRQEFEKALHSLDGDNGAWNIIAHMNSSEAINCSVSEGLGISVVSSVSAADYLAMDKIKAFNIKGLNLTRSFYLANLKNRPLSPVMSVFKAYILQYFNKKDCR